MFARFYEKVSAVFPRSFVKHVSTLMVQGGFEEMQPRRLIGFAVFFSFCMSVIIFFFSPFLTENPFVHFLAPPFAFVFFGFLFYLYLSLTADSRSRQIEFILPDVFQMISANIRAGMTLENAVWSAARPEFGALRDEIKRVSADTFGGAPITESLMGMTKRVRSVILYRAVKLVVEGIRLGGEMSQLLESVADDIRSNYQLRNEIRTSTLTYAIFIVFAATIAAPMLFSVSVFYSEMNEQVTAQKSTQLDSQQMQSAAMSAGLSGLPGMSGGGAPEQTITPQDFYWFAVGTILMINFFAGLLMSAIMSGNVLRGIKYSPLLMTVAFLLFSGALSAVRAAMGGLM